MLHKLSNDICTKEELLCQESFMPKTNCASVPDKFFYD